MKSFPLRLVPTPGALCVLLCLLACEDGLQPVPFQGASGRVRFQGAVPDSTEWVRVAVYQRVPGSTSDLFAFAAFSDTLPLDNAESPFTLPLDTGTYGWMPVVWKRADAPLSPASLRVMGWYSGEMEAFAEPRSFTVEAGRETAGIDIVADFTTLLAPEEALAILEGGG